ncbi:MAG: dioxygenase family protein [Pseudonocardiaceae bacterium]
MTSASHGGVRMPAVFIGHGNPMNAIERNVYTTAWQDLGATLPRPQAILSISAHWYVPGGRVTANEHPPTIHDFGGFPRPLYRADYPAPGSPKLAQRAAELLAPTSITLDNRWGLDHGTWSVLVHLFPKADMPVVQLGLDETLTAAEHYELAGRRRLTPDGFSVPLSSLAHLPAPAASPCLTSTAHSRTPSPPCGELRPGAQPSIG